MSSMNVNSIKSDFPILDKTVRDGKRLVYLDNAATTQKPQCVIDAISNYYTHHNSNVHRGFHQLAEEATDLYEAARERVGRFIGASLPAEIVFTRGTTESINLVAIGYGRKILKPGDQIMLTGMEHHSNIIPWQMLAKDTGAELCYIPVLDNGELDWPAFEAMLSPRVKLLSMTHMSNVLGTINPVEEYIQAAHAVGAKTVIDAAQSLPHFKVDVQALDCDFMAFSAHKMLGPMGIGGLYAKRELLEEMNPYQGGGSMINRVTPLDATWAAAPEKFEAGTPNVAGAVGFAAAIDYLDGLGMENVLRHEAALTQYVLELLDAIDGVRVIGRAPKRGGVIAWHMQQVHAHDMAQFADQDGVAIRAGHHCAQPLIKNYGLAALSRASFYIYNDRSDVEALVNTIQKTARFFDHGV